MIDNVNLNRDSIDQLLRDGAQLVIVKPDVAYLSIGSCRYYFLGNPKTEEVELFNGEKVKRTTLPYDGWERGI